MTTDLREQWEPLVGRLVLICGDVELRLLQLHWNLTIHGTNDPSLKNKGLGTKAKEMLKTLDLHKLRPSLKRDLANLLNRTLKLAQQRNLVAHNPLYMEVYSDEEGNFELVPNICSLRESKEHMSFEMLTNTVIEAKQLEADLWAAVASVGNAACEQA